MGMGGVYYAYHTTLLWLHFVTEGMAGLSFCSCYALLIDEVNELSHKISENRHSSKLLKHIQMRSSN